MKKQMTRSKLPLIAGALAFVFASAPLALGYDLGGRDREFSDPDAQGYRRDAKIADAIQSALKDDQALSAGAKSAKIIATNGNVILKGTVASPAEKVRVEKIARQVAKAALVENDLKVQTQ